MSRLDELRLLAVRLNTATTPSAELDALITEAFGFQPDGYVRARCNGKPQSYFWHATDTYRESFVPGAMTSNIDYAVALCERVLPGWTWHLSKVSCLLTKKDLRFPDIRRDGPPALALCRAVVAACIAQEEASA